MLPAAAGYASGEIDAESSCVAADARLQMNEILEDRVTQVIGNSSIRFESASLISAENAAAIQMWKSGLLAGLGRTWTVAEEMDAETIASLFNRAAIPSEQPIIEAERAYPRRTADCNPFTNNCWNYANSPGRRRTL